MTDRTLPVIVLLPAVIFLIQGGNCLRRGRPPFVRWFGALAVTLAGLNIVLAVLLLTGTLVPSREFASVMVKGTPAYFGLVALQLGLSVIAGLGWHVTRMAACHMNQLRWLMVAALLVGASAVYRVEVLNAGDPAYARVYAYNLFWPPLLLWLWFCFFESCYAILRLRSRLWRAWAHATLVVAPAIWALESLAFGTEEVKYSWWAVLIVSLPLSTGLGAWLALGGLWDRRPPLWRRLALSIAAAVNGLWLASHWLSSDIWPLASWLVWPGFPLLVGVLGLWRFWRMQRETPGPESPPLRRRQILSLVALVFIAASFTELVYFGLLGPLVPLIVFIVAWTVQAEATARGPLTRLAECAHSGHLWADHSPLRQWSTAITGRAQALWSKGLNGVHALVAMPSIPVAIAKFAVLVLGLIILMELPNAGQTVVEPFTAQVKEDGATLPLGQRISDRVLNEVALIDQRLRSDTVRLLPRGAETEPAFKLVPGSAAGAEAAFAKGSELDLGYVKVPATFLLALSRDPVRAVMGVRVITGTVQTGPGGHYLLARSSTGETWRVEPSDPDRADGGIAEKLAFEIVTGTDRAMRMAGLTHSWKAYKEFRKGLDHWQAFETGQRVEDLAAAIADFREATRSHPSFALAFYRLGLALQRDGQPTAAEEALRASLRINEDLVAAYLALASTLYDHDAYLALLPAPAAAMPPARPSRSGKKSPERLARQAEALRLWFHVIHRPPHTVLQSDRASAFYGLCRYAFDDEDFKTDKHLMRLAYYYCRRAEHLYATLPSAERASAPIKEATASVLDDLGRILTRPFADDQLDQRDADKLWRCRERIPRGPLRHAALAYLERAEELAPLNEAIKCRAAALALSLGQGERMEALEVDASARVRLAERLARRAKRRADPTDRLKNYERALTEYAEAIKLNPTMSRALNGFAYTFWEWRLVAPDQPEAAKWAREAESNARRALDVAKDRGSIEDRIEATGTLGKLLLAQARPLEAIGHLEAAQRAAPDHARWNEARWALAQAYLCANTNDVATEVAARDVVRREQALPLLDKIKELEQTRESRPFSSAPRALDPVEHPVCLRNPKAIVDPRPAPDGPRYVLDGQKLTNGANRLCDRLGVRAAVRGGTDDLVLHVWGGGVDRELPVDAPANRSVQLPSSPRATRHYYFVQLEDSAGRPVSDVHPLNTSPDEGGRCTRNLLRLEFARER